MNGIKKDMKYKLIFFPKEPIYFNSELDIENYFKNQVIIENYGYLLEICARMWGVNNILNRKESVEIYKKDINFKDLYGKKIGKIIKIS